MTPRAAIAFAAALVLTSACGGSNDASTDGTPAPTADTSAAADPEPTGDGPAPGSAAGDAAVSGPAPDIEPVPGVEPDAEAADDQPIAEADMFPDVVDAAAEMSGDTWKVSATLSSPYDTPERYADAWRVVGPDGEVYGERILTHDHADEQPFTRSQSGIAIPDEVDVITIEGRDLEFGYGGATFDLELSR